MGDTWGFTTPSFSNGAAYGDLDNDGDLDLVINNENQPSFVYKNNSREKNHNSYIGIILKGKGKNTFAVGSKIKLFANNLIYTRELIPSRGFQSSIDYKLIIGLGKTDHVDSMIITWPDRTVTKMLSPDINKVHTIHEENEKNNVLKPNPIIDNSPTFFDTIKSEFDRHQE